MECPSCHGFIGLSDRACRKCGYALVNTPKPVEKLSPLAPQCIHCGTTNQQGASTCAFCGKDPAKACTCAKCGRILPAQTRFCPGCGMYADAPAEQRSPGTVRAPRSGVEESSVSAPSPDKTEAEPEARLRSSGKYHALVIGINGYNPSVGELSNCIKDSQTVGQVLSTLYDFQVRELMENEATRDNIMKALNEYRRMLGEGDNLLIFFSGHGHYDEQTDISYWIPWDAQPDDTTKLVDSGAVIAELKRMAARHVLVVADSCFSGTITRGSGLGFSNGSLRINYLNKLMDKPARVLIASGGNEPVSDGIPGRHSIFAETFIRALINPFDSVFTAEELLTRHLKESVAGRARQTPEYSVIRNSGHDGGDFIFVKKKDL